MFTPYLHRPLGYVGIVDVVGYQLKLYTLHRLDDPFQTNRFAEAWPLVHAALPQPSVTASRPGVGFVILHQGQGADYLVLCWWDRENELPTQVFLRDTGAWRQARVSESFCVWDLQVMWHEREAYVATVLSGQANGLEAYLAK